MVDNSKEQTMNAQIAAVNEVVEAGRKEILALMKSKGYKQKTSIASAMYQTDFEKHGVVVYSIDGWHGTGKRGTCRWYGDSKSIFALYDVMKRFQGKHLIVKMDREAYMNDDLLVEIDEQKKIIAEIITFLKANA
jgi:hypothetical protein